MILKQENQGDTGKNKDGLHEKINSREAIMKIRKIMTAGMAAAGAGVLLLFSALACPPGQTGTTTTTGTGTGFSTADVENTVWHYEYRVEDNGGSTLWGADSPQNMGIDVLEFQNNGSYSDAWMLTADTTLYLDNGTYSWISICSVTGSEADTLMNTVNFQAVGDNKYEQAMYGTYEWVGSNGIWFSNSPESVTYECSVNGLYMHWLDPNGTFEMLFHKDSESVSQYADPLEEFTWKWAYMVAPGDDFGSPSNDAYDLQSGLRDSTAPNATVDVHRMILTFANGHYSRVTSVVALNDANIPGIMTSAGYISDGDGWYRETVTGSYDLFMVVNQKMAWVSEWSTTLMYDFTGNTVTFYGGGMDMRMTAMDPVQ